MDTEFEAQNKLSKLAPVLEDHAEWYGQTLRRIFYSEQFRNDPPLERPDTLQRWIDEESSDLIEKQLLQNVKRIHGELHEAAEKLMLESIRNPRPDIKGFEGLEMLYEGFLVQLRRLERDVAQTDSGIDPASGLRNKVAMVAELERELERRARRGRSFCLALARIDDFEQMQRLIQDDQQKQILAVLGRLIRKCIRSFDDGYRSGDNEFVMCLKHSDTSGGTTAINRLRNFLDQEQIKLPDGMGGFYPLTMSYCVAEPLPGDTLDDLMANMRADLETHKDGGDAAMEYKEQSALTRLVKAMGDE